MKNHTVFTRESFKKLNQYLTQRMFVQISILEVMLIGICIISYFEKKFVLMYIGIAILIIYPIFCILYRNNRINKVLQQGENMYDVSYYEYEFKEDGIKVTFTFLEEQQRQDLSYKSVFKVIEDRNNLYLFLQAKQAYIVSKNGFENSSDLNEVILKLKKNTIKYIGK